MMHCLSIPNYLPCRLNELLHCHWRVKHKRKKASQELVAYYAKDAGIPPAMGKRRVSLILTLKKGGKRGDVDGWWKDSLDSLVQSGLLIDDGFDWVELGSIEFRRAAQPATTIILEDL